MRPFPGTKMGDPRLRVYNYRLSRVRRVSENAFGILVQRFRCFRGPLQVSADHAIKVIRSACVLHNLLREQSMREGSVGVPEDSEDLAPESAFRHLVERIASNTHSRGAAAVRDSFTEYFCAEGAVAWQGYASQSQ